MKISTAPLAALGLAVSLALPATTLAAAPTTTLKGEIVDTACYLDHGARGEKHKQCALNCIAGGVAPSLLTDDGKLYVLLPPHGSHDAFNKVKEMAAQTVTVKGQVLSKGGVEAMIVTAVE